MSDAMPNIVVFHVPTDQEFLCAYGRVSICHAHLDHVLKMTIKSLSGISVDEATKATAFHGSAILRERIVKLARARFGEGATLLRLQAILENCRQLTETRNDLIHNFVASNWQRDDPHMLGHEGRQPLPSAQELNGLANAIKAAYCEINDARLSGWLFEALNRKPPPP